VTLAVHLLVQQNQVEVRQTAWYQKSLATFSDAIGWVRHQFWSAEADVTFSKVNQKDQMIKISAAFLQRLIDTVCYAA
jgi:predicted nucleic-acid-binding protein